MTGARALPPISRFCLSLTTSCHIFFHFNAVPEIILFKYVFLAVLYNVYINSIYL